MDFPGRQRDHRDVQQPHRLLIAVGVTLGLAVAATLAVASHPFWPALLMLSMVSIYSWHLVMVDRRRKAREQIHIEIEEVIARIQRNARTLVHH